MYSPEGAWLMGVSERLTTPQLAITDEDMGVRGHTGILAVFCLWFAAQQVTGQGDTGSLVSVGRAVYTCMSGRLTEAVHQLQLNATAATDVNNCWYRREYEKCLSDNLSTGPASHVTEFNKAVYPENCVSERATFTKCVSDAMSELSKYSCEARVTEDMKRMGNSSISTERLKEAYCRASVTGYDCVLSVVKYCGVSQGPGVVDSLSSFSRVRAACATLLPTTTTPAPADIGPIGDLFPKSFFTTTGVNAALSSGTRHHPHPVRVTVYMLVLLLVLNCK